MKSIHTNLKAIRMEKGLTQEAVAERVGLTRQALSGYETGKRQPGIDVLIKLAEIYEVSIEDILSGQKADIGKQRVKRIAVAVAVLFLTLQLLAGLFSTLSFVLYPIEEGLISPDQIEIAEKHFETGEWSERAEKIAASVLTLGSVIVLGFDLAARRSFSWKRKLIFFLTVLAMSWFIAVFWSMVHPVFVMMDFVISGPFHFISAAVLLIVDLVITSFRKQRSE